MSTGMPVTIVTSQAWSGFPLPFHSFILHRLLRHPRLSSFPSGPHILYFLSLLVIMGGHSQNIRRAALNHRRLADGGVLQNLAPRFIPTAIFTTWDTNAGPNSPQSTPIGKSLDVVYLSKNLK
jgi:hypothetical protein